MNLLPSIMVVMMMAMVSVASADILASVPFSGSSTSQEFILTDSVVVGCSAGQSAIMYPNGTVIGCYDSPVVDGQSYMTGATGYTPAGIVEETGVAWFKRLASPIAGLDPTFALYIALGIMMFTSLMAGITTAPAISLCVTFEGWVFYGMNMFTLIDYSNVNSDIGDVVPAALTVMTIVTIVWLFLEYRRKNK